MCSYRHKSLSRVFMSSSNLHHVIYRLHMSCLSCLPNLIDNLTKAHSVIQRTFTAFVLLRRIMIRNQQTDYLVLHQYCNRSRYPDTVPFFFTSTLTHVTASTRAFGIRTFEMSMQVDCHFPFQAIRLRILQHRTPIARRCVSGESQQTEVSLR